MPLPTYIEHMIDAMVSSKEEQRYQHEATAIATIH
jgi:hypothetical protein